MQCGPQTDALALLTPYYLQSSLFIVHESNMRFTRSVLDNDYHVVTAIKPNQAGQTVFSSCQNLLYARNGAVVQAILSITCLAEATPSHVLHLMSC